VAAAPATNVVPLFGLEDRSDDELVLLTHGGRRDAFDVLVARHQAAVLKIAAKYLGDTAAAKDACQNAFLEIYRGVGRYRPQRSFGFFLRRVVLNQCRMSARRVRLGERVAPEPPPPPTQPDEAVLAEERRRLVEAGLLELSHKLREVVVLRYAGDHPLDEIAQILELPPGTVKSRLFAAMARLKDVLGGSP
jgi:RNA polymerase sigma-70 factor (ECF subfamily)